MTINLTIDLEQKDARVELAKYGALLTQFAAAMVGEEKEAPKKNKKAPETCSVEMTPPAASAPQAPVPVVPVTAIAPVTPAVNNAFNVPTAAPVYTLEILAQACAPLMDAGYQSQLIGLLAKYKVQALTMLPAEAYPAFAADLRTLGAKL
jgi:hypothetical protein